jgi:hypothetical protein
MPHADINITCSPYKPEEPSDENEAANATGAKRASGTGFPPAAAEIRRYRGWLARLMNTADKTPMKTQEMGAMQELGAFPGFPRSK